MRCTKAGGSWRRRAGAALLATGLGVMLAACGGASPTASPSSTALPSTTSPSTAGSNATPASVLPLLDKALQEQNQAKYAQAVVDFLTVVEVDPASQIAWYDLGVIAHFHGEDAQAAHDYQSALVADPSYLPALYNLAVLEASGAPKEAAALYETLIGLQPGNAAAHLNLGFVLVALHEPSQAKAEFATAFRLDPALVSRVPAADRPAT